MLAEEQQLRAIAAEEVTNRMFGAMVAVQHALKEAETEACCACAAALPTDTTTAQVLAVENDFQAGFESSMAELEVCAAAPVHCLGCNGRQRRSPGRC